MSKRIIDIPTGRTGEDGILKLQQFTSDIIAVTISHVSERVPPLLLTKAQSTALRDALDQLLPDLEEAPPVEDQIHIESTERRDRAA